MRTILGVAAIVALLGFAVGLPAARPTPPAHAHAHEAVPAAAPCAPLPPPPPPPAPAHDLAHVHDKLDEVVQAVLFEARPIGVELAPAHLAHA
ncbi:hypothetical protein R5R35_009530 [Gryllus longicercus]|uniref:Accessory gland protein n=1 Tax=Gryllus longicercus TaxID=2509291 RepID=A0AAN9Z687_9ORTH